MLLQMRGQCFNGQHIALRTKATDHAERHLGNIRQMTKVFLLDLSEQIVSKKVEMLVDLL